MEPNIRNNDMTRDLIRLQKNLKEASESMDSQVKYEDIVIFIGSTKSGKSCLINYIIGNKLIGQKNFPSMPVAIRKFGDSNGPQIGRGSCSETIIPTRWENETKLPRLALWDAPGFNDNRGPVQDITNAYYIYKLFRNVKSVKIALVTDINDIMNDSVHSFLMLLNAVELILKEKIIDHFSSIVVIFTKVPEKINDNDANISNVCELLKDQFLSTDEIYMSEISRNFLRCLIRGTNIGLFMKAKAGPIDNSIDKGIIAAISNANSIPEHVLKQVASPSIAHESKIFLLETRRELSSVEAFYELQDVINDVSENFVRNFASIQETENSREILESIITELSNRADEVKCTLEPAVSFQEKLQILGTLDPKIFDKIATDNLLEKSILMEFVDSLLNLEESQDFSVNLKRIVENVIQKINELIITIRLKINEIERIEFMKQTREMQEKHNQEMITLQMDLEEKLRLNEISKEEFEKQMHDFQKNNSELMEKLETERANNAKHRDDLLKLTENMQAEHGRVVQELQSQLRVIQERNEETLRQLKNAQRGGRRGFCSVM